MRLSFRVVCLAAIATVLASASAVYADPISIDVAEFRWHVEGDSCDPANPTDVDCLSVFGLTYLWSGPTPEPVVSGELSIDGSFYGSFFDLDPSLPFDQFSIAGVPTTAQASISFFFGTQIPMSAILTGSDALFTPDGVFHLFTYEYDDGAQQVPEPSALALAGLGAVMAWGARRRVRA